MLKHGLDRDVPESPGERSVSILYFMHLVDIAGLESEQATLPETVTTVEELLNWLSRRGEDWAEYFTVSQVQVTLNKEFAEPTTPISQGDEIAIVPRERK